MVQIVDPASVAGQIASHGILGLVTVIALYVAWNKDKELTEERLARINDAKSYTDLALKLQGQVIDSVNKLTDVAQMIRQIMPPARGGGS